MDHSIIAASSASIWGKGSEGCTGWPLMSQQFPETEESQDAMDGNASHEIGYELIERCKRGNTVSTFRMFDGKAASNGIAFTEEMFDAAKIYAENVHDVMQKTCVFGGPNLGVEQRLECPDIHELSFGTSDCFLFDTNTYHLYIWDYKFGHDVVEVFENWQLLVYFSGITRLLKLRDQNLTVHFRIVQPRAFHRDGIIREWVVNAAKLRGYVNTLHNNAHIALSNDAMCRSGSHCKNCSARHACPTALQAGIQLYEVAKQPMALELSPAALGVQLGIVKRAIKQLESIESGMFEQVKNLVRSGSVVPGWTLEPGAGREEWTKPISEVLAMGNFCGIDLSKPDKAITPKQARTKGIDDAVLSEYSEVKQTGLQLVPDTGNKLKRLFS